MSTTLVHKRKYERCFPHYTTTDSRISNNREARISYLVHGRIRAHYVTIQRDGHITRYIFITLSFSLLIILWFTTGHSRITDYMVVDAYVAPLSVLYRPPRYIIHRMTWSSVRKDFDTLYHISVQKYKHMCYVPQCWHQYEKVFWKKMKRCVGEKYSFCMVAMVDKYHHWCCKARATHLPSKGQPFVLFAYQEDNLFIPTVSHL